MQKLYIFIIIIYLFEEQYEFLRLNARGTKSNKAVGNIYSKRLLPKNVVLLFTEPNYVVRQTYMVCHIARHRIGLKDTAS